MDTQIRRSAKVICLTACIFLLPSVVLFSADIESIDVKGGVIWIGNEPADTEGKDAAPHPLATVVGVSLPIRFSSLFSLVPELRYYGLPYGMEYGRAVPVEIEFASWPWVLGFLLEPRAVFDFHLADTLTISPYASPTFLFRIPVPNRYSTDIEAIAAYHYGMGRFFYPEVGVVLDWELPFRNRSPLAETLNEEGFNEEPPYEGIEIHFVVDVNAYFPVFHIWDGEERKFYDQFMASGAVGLRVFLPPRQDEPS